MSCKHSVNEGRFERERVFSLFMNFFIYSYFVTWKISERKSTFDDKRKYRKETQFTIYPINDHLF